MSNTWWNVLNRRPRTFQRSHAETWVWFRATRNNASSCTRSSSHPDRRSSTFPGQCNTACSLKSARENKIYVIYKQQLFIKLIHTIYNNIIIIIIIWKMKYYRCKRTFERDKRFWSYYYFIWYYEILILKYYYYLAVLRF